MNNRLSKKTGVFLLVCFLFICGMMVIVWNIRVSKKADVVDSVSISRDDLTIQADRDGIITVIDSEGNSERFEDKPFAELIFNAQQQSSQDGRRSYRMSVSAGEDFEEYVVSDSAIDEIFQMIDGGGSGGGGGSLNGDEGSGDPGEDSSESTYEEIFPVSSPTVMIFPSPTSVLQRFREDCMFWKLSYCAVPWPTITPIPTIGITPTITPIPSDERTWDCSTWSSENVQSTVIGDTVCVVEE
jgi:hypothetical protein